jgi:hypothetical protein
MKMSGPTRVRCYRAAHRRAHGVGGGTRRRELGVIRTPATATEIGDCSESADEATGKKLDAH